jgi:hypothetical protein
MFTKRRRDIFVLWKGVSMPVVEMRLEMEGKRGRKGDFLGRRIGNGIWGGGMVLELVLKKGRLRGWMLGEIIDEDALRWDFSI